MSQGEFWSVGVVKGFRLGNREDSHPKHQSVHLVIGVSLHEHGDAVSKAAVLHSRTRGAA
jgi:hypothetical protein